MIISSGHKGVWIDLGDNKPGMKLQRWKHGQDWKNYLINRRLVRSPVDIETLHLASPTLIELSGCFDFCRLY